MPSTSAEDVLAQVQKIIWSLRIRKPHGGPLSFFSFAVSLLFALGAGVNARFAEGLAATPVLEEAEIAVLAAMAVLHDAELDDAAPSLDEAMPEATAAGATADALETSAPPSFLTIFAKRSPGGSRCAPAALPYLQTASRKAASKLPRAFAINPVTWYSKGRSLK